MTSASSIPCLAAGAWLVLAAAAASAQTVPAPPPGAAPAPEAAGSAPNSRLSALGASYGEPVERREPDVHHNVFEDGGSKIDELVVRGEVQRVVVTPKVGTTRSYEIIVQRGGRSVPDSTGGAMSAVGKRVWNVLAF